MRILVAYDVSTESQEGKRRLRRVAKVCQNFGQRVQKSLFECEITETSIVKLEIQLLAEIDQKEDNLRLYRLNKPYDQYVRQFGRFRAVDFDDTLIV
jgi:CRISPR-associated protein Cas2